MPYFCWRGVTLDGSTQRGKRFAVSEYDLDQQLIKQHIALMGCKTVTLPFWHRNPHHRYMASVFRQLSSLVRAGVLLPEALHIVALQHAVPGTQYAMHMVAIAVQDGHALSSALKKYPSMTNDIMIQLIRAGEESGNVAYALHTLANYLEREQQFSRRLRRALMLPIITLLFFMVLVLVVFLIMVPYFAQIIRSINKPLPSTTLRMLSVSEFLLHNGKTLMTLLLMVLISFWIFMRTKRYKGMMDMLFLYIPGVNRIIKERFLIYFFQSMAMLIKGGVSLEGALTINAQSTSNETIKNMVGTIRQQVTNGFSLRYACSAYPWFFNHDVLALIEVGQESGNLTKLLHKIGLIYQEQLKRRLAIITQLLQPMLMLLLGILVLLLILGVYLPIFNLSYAI